MFAGPKTERKTDLSTMCLTGLVQMESVERQARLLRDLSQVSPLVPLLLCNSDLRLKPVSSSALAKNVSFEFEKVLASRGIEPMTLALLAPRSNQLS